VARENNFFTPESDYKFHMRLLEIAHNSSVKQFQKIVYPVFEFARENFQEFLASYRKNKERLSFVSHRDLIEILKTGDREEFRQALKAHLDIYLALLKQHHRRES
jgi:DNA-binding FadR family transcriptional regulator